MRFWKYLKSGIFPENNTNRVFPLIAVFFIFLLLSPLQGIAASDNYSEIGFGGGVAGVFDEKKRTYIMAEYRFKYDMQGIFPWVTLHTSGRESYLTAGFFRDFDLSKHWCITPGFSVGLYGEREGINLGSPLEFKSTIELSYKTEKNRRIGARLSHVSNGGIDEHNPGAEMLTFFFTLPVRD